MTVSAREFSSENFLADVVYPDEDGLPMAESDAARDYLTYAVEALSACFQDDINSYVSGNLFIYYEQGNPKAVVSPDVFVVFGVPKQKRRSYKLWEEGNKAPDFVLEITSKTTVSEDQGVKKGVYAFLGVQEYFQYDPTGDYLSPVLKGFHLVNGHYLPLPLLTVNDTLSLSSEVLGLELRVQAGELRFYNPETGERLLSYWEAEQARQEAEQARQEAEQARQEEQARSQRLAAKLRELGIDPDTV